MKPASDSTELLQRAERRLRRGWTQGAWCRLKSGAPRAATVDTATCWCLVGALRAEGASQAAASQAAAYHPVYKDALARLVRQLPAGFRRAFDDECLLLEYNDVPERTRAEVLALVRAALQGAGWRAHPR